MKSYSEQDYSSSLYHHGILGMKWGVRRYQNKDGTLTQAGKERYAKNADKIQKLVEKRKNDQAALDDLTKNGYKSEQFTNRYPFGDHYTDKQFKRVYDISKKDALDHTERVLKNRVVRDEYRRKMLAGEELNEEEAKLLREDSIKAALIVAGATGIGVYAAYKMGVFDKKPEVGDVASGILEQSLSEGEVERVIKQGFDFHRMSGWQQEDFSKRSALYVTATEADRDIYKAWLRDWHHTGERWEATLRATKDIKVAGSKKQKELLRELLEDNDYFDDFARKCMGTSGIFSKRDRDMAREYVLRDDIFDSMYKKSIYDLVKQDSTVAKRYIDYAMSKGYDAFVDDFDRGSMSYTPIILFNPKDVVERVGSTKVGMMDQAAAERRLYAKGIVAGLFGITLPDKGR